MAAAWEKAAMARPTSSPPRWFAAIYDAIMAPIEASLLGAMRARLLGDLAGDVLEIGIGTGANLHQVEAGIRAGRIRWTGTDPSDAMLKRARRAASDLPVRFELAPAEALPFADASFDAVVATLALCSVADPARGLAEIRRVLRPGGELRLLEHVRGDGWGGRCQDWLTPLWTIPGAGCHLNRRTAELLRAAGFESDALSVARAPFPLLRLVCGRSRVLA